jgi:hypothetical protein
MRLSHVRLYGLISAFCSKKRLIEDLMHKYGGVEVRGIWEVAVPEN